VAQWITLASVTMDYGSRYNDLQPGIEVQASPNSLRIVFGACASYFTETLICLQMVVVSLPVERDERLVMSIFSWLVIGHFVGDWMLQNDWMARHKRGRWWSAPCIVHCLVYSIVIVQAAWIGSRGALPAVQLGAFFALIFVTHWLIDGFDLARRWGNAINQTQNDSVRIVVDQTMHMIVLAGAASFLLV